MNTHAVAPLIFVALILPAAHAQKETPDLCTPPPSAVRPSLPAKLMHGQGKVHFPITTTNPKTQEFFDQGVAQMHSFWAFEAERSFLQAAELDPEAPMPHWGIAMVAAGDFRPRFQSDLIKKVSPGRMGVASRVSEAARKAVELSQVPGKATPIEKLYIEAMAARREESAKDPEEGYTQALRRLLAQYPKEVEAKSYLALHLMRGFELPDKTPRSTSMEAVALLRELLIEAPDHPGVHHYVIHGFEGSTFAHEAFESCKRYAELAPNIPHALHMPGHIYSQTGRWQDAVASFTAAMENELGYIRRDPLYGKGHHGHNVHYLATSYSFLGKSAQAIEAASTLLEFKENPREAAAVDAFYSTYRQGWFALLRTLVQAERWDDGLAGKILPEYDKPRERAWTHWARALAHIASGSLASARMEARGMDAALKDYKAKTGLPVAAELAVARLELRGHLSVASGKVDAGLRTLQEAARRERALAYTEPPYYPRPVNEALGRVALRHGRLDLARRSFEEALVQYPASAHAETGLREIERRARLAGESRAGL